MAGRIRFRSLSKERVIDDKGEEEKEGEGVNGEAGDQPPLQAELDLVRKQLAGLQQECEGMRDEGTMKDEQISALKDSLSELSALLQEKDGRIQQLDETCQTLNSQLTVVSEKKSAEVHPSSSPWWSQSRRLPRVTSDSSVEEEEVSTVGVLNGSHADSGFGILEEAPEEAPEEEDREGGSADTSFGVSILSHHRSTSKRGECSCGGSARVQRLRQRIQRLERMLWGKDDVIGSLKAENKRLKTELLEFQQQKLQRTISEIDSTIAVLELQPNASSRMEKLKADKGRLVAELKEKVSQKVRLFRRDSEDVMGAFTAQYQDCDKEQVCEVLRALDTDSVRLKKYIDELLARVLERNPAILEGMPRIQQNRGLQPDLMRGASTHELLEELHEREKNFEALESYATLLLHRVMEQAPDILEDEEKTVKN